MRHQPAAFPVGLYGMLLFALCWLTLPAVFAPLERVLLGAACLVPRVVGSWSGTPAVAATRDVVRLAELGAELAARLRRQDIEGGRALLSVRFEPVFCSVREVAGDGRHRGGAGLPAELRLAQTHGELADCAPFVTKGDTLLGFLVRPGTGSAVDDGPDDPARVQLLHHRDAPPVFAAMPLDDGGQLRLVVRGAATVDPAPLSADLWDDPYRAARLDRGGDCVRTLAIEEGAVAVPEGFQLGRTRIWGYEGGPDDPTLTIGVFVVPPHDPRALSHVVVWRDRLRAGEREIAVARPAAPLRRHRGIVRDLPGAIHGRHLLISDAPLADGAAVVHGGLLLGTARRLAFGMGLVTAFAATRHPWSLLLLPDGGAAARELGGEVVHAEAGEAWLRVHDADAAGGGRERLPPGQLFTGSNGPGCPAGLWIGSVEPHPRQPGLLLVRTLSPSGPRIAEVLVADGGGQQ